MHLLTMNATQIFITQDDEIHALMRFHEDLKKTKFDKQLSYTGIVNLNNLSPKAPKCKETSQVGVSVERYFFHQSNEIYSFNPNIQRRSSTLFPIICLAKLDKINMLLKLVLIF